MNNPARLEFRMESVVQIVIVTENARKHRATVFVGNKVQSTQVFFNFTTQQVTSHLMAYLVELEEMGKVPKDSFQVLIG